MSKEEFLIPTQLREVRMNKFLANKNKDGSVQINQIFSIEIHQHLGKAHRIIAYGGFNNYQQCFIVGEFENFEEAKKYFQNEILPQLEEYAQQYKDKAIEICDIRKLVAEKSTLQQYSKKEVVTLLENLINRIKEVA